MTDLKSIMAALSVLEPPAFVDAEQDQRLKVLRMLPAEVQFDDLAVLDSFAVSCVHEGSDSYAVTILQQTQTFLIAVKDCKDTNGLEAHIRKLWGHLCAAADASSNKALYNAAFLDIEQEIWRYSWTAIHARWMTDSLNLEQCIRTLLDEAVEGELKDQDREFAEAVVERLADVRSRVQSFQYDGENVSVFNDALVELWHFVIRGLYTRQRARGTPEYRLLRHVEGRDAVPARSIFRKLLFPVEAMTGFVRYTKSRNFAALKQTAINVIILNPFSQAIEIDLDTIFPKLMARKTLTDERCADYLQKWPRVVKKVTQNIRRDKIDVHAECTILSYLRSLNPSHQTGLYVATSEHSCCACWDLFEEHSKSVPMTAGIHLRGSHTFYPLEWPIPQELEGLSDPLAPRYELMVMSRLAVQPLESL